MQSEGTTCCLLFEFRRTRSASRCGLAFSQSIPDGRKARSLSAQHACQYRAKMAGLKQEEKRHKLNIFLQIHSWWLPRRLRFAKLDKNIFLLFFQPIDWREITD